MRRDHAGALGRGSALHPMDRSQPHRPSLLARRLNKHSAQFSGLANFGKTVDVALSGKGIVLKTSSKKKGGKLVSQQTKTSAARAARSAAAVARNAGRPDLQVGDQTGQDG